MIGPQPTVHEATCSCGGLSLKAYDEPVKISVCHCLACQRRTGSAFGLQARFTTDAIEVAGKYSSYVRTADSGNRSTYHFCGTCGATVFYSSENEPDVVAVPVGAFADPHFPPPTVSSFGHRKHEWVDLHTAGSSHS